MTLSGTEAPFYFSALLISWCHLMDQNGCRSSSYYICNPASKEEDIPFKDTSWTVYPPFLLIPHWPKLSHVATPRCKRDLGASHMPVDKPESLRKVSGGIGSK